MEIDAKRLKIYEIGFLLSLVLAGLTSASGRESWIWACLGAGLAATLVSLIAGRGKLPDDILDVMIFIGAGATIAGPIAAGMSASGTTLAQVLHGLIAWPLVLVALMGSRVLVAANDLSFHRFWLRPRIGTGGIRRQSFLAAGLLGAGLLLIMEWSLGNGRVQTADPAIGIIVSALTGTTIIHYAILLLFFIVLGWLVDAVILHLGDRSAAARLIASIGSPAFPNLFAFESHRSVAHVIAATLRPQGDSNAALTAFRGFDQASRGYVRGLLPLLPLLGFLGTVIGLARAVADLPAGLSSGNGAADFAGTLSGLAIKFETTLLGLLASMVATWLINWLDKQELEFASECSLAASRASEPEPHP